jgi:hypothetical protein
MKTERIKEYKVILCKGREREVDEDFEIQLNDSLMEGWLPLGNHSLSTVHVPNEEEIREFYDGAIIVLSQVMVKYVGFD